MPQEIQQHRVGYISSRAELGARVRVGRGVQIFGNVIIGDDAVIDSDVTLGYPRVEGIRALFGSGDAAPTEELLDRATAKTTVIGAGSLLRRFTVIYEDVRIGMELDCAHDVIVREGCSLGDRVELSPRAYIKSDARIGDHTRVGAIVCDRASIGNHCAIYGDIIHKFQSGISGVKEDSPVIEDGAVVGIRACVIGPVTIGRLSLVGAGSVVTHDVAEKTVVAGNPARYMRAREWAEAAELWSRVLGCDLPV